MRLCFIDGLKNRHWILPLLLAALVLAFALSIALGSVTIPLSSVLRILLGGEVEREAWATIIWQLRLPKALTAACAGAALAMAGLQMQTLFRNPLADPFVLGISSGAGLGVALVVLMNGAAGAAFLVSGNAFISSLGTIAAACIGAASVFALITLASHWVENSVTLLVLGLMFGYATSAIVSILLFFSSPERMQAYIAWTFGSFGGVTWPQLRVLGPVVLMGLLIAALCAKPLNALLLGENYARSMGLHITRTRMLITASASILSGAVTAFCGPIGFVGVAVPHLARNLLRTSDHHALWPVCMAMGATLALLCDLATHAGQYALPLNAITSLIGAPVVVWVILRRQGK